MIADEVINYNNESGISFQDEFYDSEYEENKNTEEGSMFQIYIPNDPKQKSMIKHGYYKNEPSIENKI